MRPEPDPGPHDSQIAPPRGSIATASGNRRSTDDEAVLSVAAKVLSRGGYSVISASGGHEALDLAEAAEGQVSLLLSDLVMPEMSGRDLGEIFEGRYPEIPVLYMSAYTEDEVILQGLRFSEVNFMPKPFTVDGLLLKAREVIEQGEG